MKIIDLTHQIDDKIPVFPGDDLPKIIEKNTMERDHFRQKRLEFSTHTGTHIDSPAHMLKDGLFLDDYEVEQFMGKALILDFTEHKSTDITYEDIMMHQNKVREVDFVILNTGWNKYWGTDKYFDRFPTLTEEAADYLTKFNLKGIGIDALSLDDINSKTFNIHKILLKNNLMLIENLNNLYSLPKDKSFLLSVLPIKLIKADGSPVRAIAIIDESY